MFEKIPWWLKSLPMINLVIMSVWLGSQGQLFYPAFGLLLEEQGLLFHFGFLLMTGMVSQFIGSLCVRSLCRRWNPKKAVQIMLGMSLVPDVLLIFAVGVANPLLYYMVLAIGPGLGSASSAMVSLMLQWQLKEDRIVGEARVSSATTVTFAIFTWLGFQFPTLVWAYCFVGFKIFLLILTIYIKPEAAEPKEQTLRGLVGDPATRIQLGNVCVLFVFYCFSKLLPLASVVDKDNVDDLLFWTTLLSGLLQERLRTYINRHRSASSLLILICRAAMLVGLGLMLVSGGSWIVIIVGAGLWTLGICCRQLITTVSYENSNDKVLAVTLRSTSWSLTSLIGGAYIWLTEANHVSHQTALEWLIYPAAVSAIIALPRFRRIPRWLPWFPLWQLHKLPPKEEQKDEKPALKELSTTQATPVTAQSSKSHIWSIAGATAVIGIVLWIIRRSRRRSRY